MLYNQGGRRSEKKKQGKHLPVVFKSLLIQNVLLFSGYPYTSASVNKA